MKTDWMREWRPLIYIAAGFAVSYFLPVGIPRFDNAVTEAMTMVRWYAREHVILCLLPAFFIAGAIAVFISQGSVMKYLGAKANKVLAYGVASVSGAILAVCSCTVLPLFAGIYKLGAGLGPATAFLYSGPAINALAIILTARILGVEIGIARAVMAVFFSIIIGLLMHFIFRREEIAKANAQAELPVPEPTRPLWKNALFFAALVAIMIFATWAEPNETSGAIYTALYNAKWILTAISGVILGYMLVAWINVEWWKVALVTLVVVGLTIAFPGLPVVPFLAAIIGVSIITSTNAGEAGGWFDASWGYTKQIMPLLLLGVFFAGIFLGMPGREGLIPNAWVSAAVGGNSLTANLLASIVGAFMYFATITEVPIVQGLMGSGMGKGPALALLLAGPALSLPSMLVLHSVMGLKKTVTFAIIVVVLSTVSGMLFGHFFG